MLEPTHRLLFSELGLILDWSSDVQCLTILSHFSICSLQRALLPLLCSQPCAVNGLAGVTFCHRLIGDDVLDFLDKSFHHLNEMPF